MLVSLIFTPDLKERFKQWEVVKDVPHDVSGRHDMKMGEFKIVLL
jgi:hypothetical protein